MEAKVIDDAVLGKIQDLKRLFQLGSDLVPFVEEIFKFLKDVIPLINKVSDSLIESTTHMPAAQEKLDSANKTTEMATNQILDKLDSINERLQKLSENYGSSDNPETAAEIIQNIQDDSFEIIAALQFQDITSQQLAYARGVFQAIYDRFELLFNALNELNVDENLKSLIVNKLTPLSPENVSSIQAASEDIIRNKGISQDEIDQLFG